MLVVVRIMMLHISNKISTLHSTKNVAMEYHVLLTHK